MLCLKSTVVARPQLARPSTRRAVVVVRAESKPVDVAKKVLNDAIKEADEACANGTTQDCAVAWDNVEEISAAISHKKEANKAPEISDPLEAFCKDAPDADECRVYDD